MASGMKILIVDDEPDIRALVGRSLEREGFTAITAATGLDGLRAATTEQPVLIVLDLNLPDVSGTEVCRRLRADEATRAIPIIMLSARGEEIDRVVGFEVGADDYVVKSSFSVRELMLRIRAVLRRTGASQEAAQSTGGEARTFGALKIDKAAHRVWVAGEAVSLTATEFKLLTVLSDRAGLVQTRGVLLQDVWEMPPDLNTRTVDTHIKRLREKLGASAGHLETVRGIGYRFTPHLDAH